MRVRLAWLAIVLAMLAGCADAGSDRSATDGAPAASEASSHPSDGATAAGGQSPTEALLDPSDSVWLTQAPDTFSATFETSEGAFVVEVVRDRAPLGVDRFYNLARMGYYDDSRFFRVVADFIAQFGIPGDPRVTAAWADRPLSDDPVQASNVRGTLAYAMTGPDTRETQIYINLVDNVRLDSTGFAPFGAVTRGMEVVDALYAGYGENAGGGMRRGQQDQMLNEGNAHLDAAYPELSRILRIVVR
jgi:homoserine O-acetyltransferase